MKLLLIITIFLSNLLFADSNYNKNYRDKMCISNVQMCDWNRDLIKRKRDSIG